MTDLQCAARLFVARHADATYESDLLSDDGGWLTSLGRDQARRLAEEVAPQRITRVWTSDLARAVQTGEIVAGVLGVDVVVRRGLRELGVGDAAGTSGEPDPLAATFAAWLDGDLDARVPGGESGHEIVERCRLVLEEVADAHRGESVLVVSHGGVMCLALPALARNLASGHARDLPLPNGGVVALEGDADGWVARSWVGTRLDDGRG
ncbi:putative phosphoglycerate mutase [Nocardioides cavernae]|uniref:Putative phosphoglycerate mutase n=1 Tax=Nocardioides cavernae TaxID=1921566 RepID=A0A7Y9KTL9_9ACTN|nr:histidine phosphatase family protein [Nocardioides cavernae]NYE37737.1 putative phosphoglycerate mutase [Nocardioides cavernae]